MKRQENRLFIPFELLKKFSDENFNNLNRSVDVDELLNIYPNIVGVLSSLQLEHQDTFGDTSEAHYRYVIDGILVKDSDDTYLETFMLQDITKEQHETILLIKQEILTYQDDTTN